MPYLIITYGDACLDPLSVVCVPEPRFGLLHEAMRFHTVDEAMTNLLQLQENMRTHPAWQRSNSENMSFAIVTMAEAVVISEVNARFRDALKRI